MTKGLFVLLVSSVFPLPFSVQDNLAIVVGTGYGNGYLTWHVTCEMDPFLVFSEVRHLYRL